MTDSATVTPPPDGKPAELESVSAALATDYEILGELGRGGMAVVYRAREKELDREVAIKVLPMAMAFDSEFVERFQREARTSGKLEHPHIVPIYRVGRQGNTIYFVMKLLTGQSLATVLRDRKKLEVGEVRRIILETAGALGYAARRGVVHRDIKPDNILLDGEGRCVVTDFGIAKTASGPMTAAGTSMGTPRYMSPEHAQGSKVDGRSDIYSLGVVAYQCLTGATPFDADDPFAVLYKHINEPVPRPALETDEEWALYTVIEKMLAKKPEDRFQDADAIISALGGQVQTITLVNPQQALQSAFGPTEIIPTPLPWQHRKLGPATQGTWAIIMAVVGVFMLASFTLASLGPDTEAVADSARAGSTTGARIAAAGATTGATTSVRVAGATTGAAAPTGATGGAPGATAGATKTASAAAATRPAPRGPPSKCPAVGSARMRGLGVPGLLADSVRDLTVGKKLVVNYDVCGLGAGDPYTAHLTVSKNQNRARRLIGGTMKPILFPFLEVASGPRMRIRKTLDLSTLGEGSYSLKIAVSDKAQRLAEHTREFQIVKPVGAP